jgi:hypothetical protein
MNFFANGNGSQKVKFVLDLTTIIMGKHNALSQVSPKPPKETFERSYLSSLHNTLTGSNAKQVNEQDSPFEFTKKTSSAEKNKSKEVDTIAKGGRMPIKEFTMEEIMKLIGELKTDIKSINEKVNKIHESVGFKLANIQAEVVILNGKLNYIESNIALTK